LGCVVPALLVAFVFRPGPPLILIFYGVAFIAALVTIGAGISRPNECAGESCPLPAVLPTVGTGATIGMVVAAAIFVIATVGDPAMLDSTHGWPRWFGGALGVLSCASAGAVLGGLVGAIFAGVRRLSKH
jgi:hypothetical protein